MKISLGITIVFCVLLTGCQSTSLPVQQDPAQLSQTRGYVFVEFPKKEYILRIKSIEDGRNYELQTAAQSAGLWVPPGTYQLYGLRGNVIGPTNEVFDVSGYPPFEIKKGVVTNLGALVNFSVGEGKVLWLQRPSKNSDGRLKRWLSVNESYLETSDVITWQVESVPDAIETDIRGNGFLVDLLIEAENKSLGGQLQTDLLTIKDVDKLYDRLVLKSLPQTHFNELGIVHVTNDNQGNQYFPAQLGQIKKRNKEGSWISIDTGYTSSVKTLQVDESFIYAGLASGQLILSRDSGNSWDEIYHFDGMTVSKVHKVGQKLFVLTHHSANKSSHIFSSDLKSKLEFVELKKSNRAISIEPMSQQVGNTLYFNLSVEEIFKLKADSMAITVQPIPDSLINFYVSPEGSITVMTRSVFGNLHVSDPYGKNWKEIDFPKMGKAYFSSYDTGAAFAWGKVKEYDSNKEKWKSVANFHDGCLVALVDEEKLDLFCTDIEGNIFKYHNKNWKPENYL